MTVYVDGMRAPFRGYVMCHMLADSTEELVRMAERIGLDRRWIQKPGTRHEHFDITLEKRAEAIRAGAIEVDRRELGRLIADRASSGWTGAGKRGGPAGS